MKRVLIFGVFDLLHEGHKYFLNKSKDYGGFLIVSVARDEYVLKHKGRTPAHNERERMQALKDSGLADSVLLSDSKIGSFEIIRKTKPDVICLGYDQHNLKNKLNDWIASEGLEIQVKVIPPYKEDTYKTTFLLGNKRPAK